jgi:hypothetical protein
MPTYLAMYDAYAGVINDLTNLPPHMPSLPQPSIGASVKAAQLNQNYFSAKKLFLRGLLLKLLSVNQLAYL